MFFQHPPLQPLLLETRKLGGRIHKSTSKRTEEEIRQGESKAYEPAGGSLKGHFDYLVGKDGCLQRAQHPGQRLDEPSPFKSQKTAAGPAEQ